MTILQDARLWEVNTGGGVDTVNINGDYSGG